MHPHEVLRSTSTTTRLLALPLEWRTRAVERLEFDAAGYLLRRRSLQIAPLRQLVADLLPSEDGPDGPVVVALPLALMPKGPLLDVDIRGPQGDAVLLPRQEAAVHELSYVRHLAALAAHSLNPRVALVAQALLEHTGVVRLPEPDADSRVIARYLHQHDLDVGRAVARRLATCTRRAEQALQPWSGGPLDTVSTTASPYLAVPVLLRDAGLPDLPAAVRHVEEYAEVLDDLATAALAQASPTAAQDLLSVLSDYGRHFEMVVHVELDLDRDCLLRLRHRAAFRLSALRHRARVDAVMADCLSNHVSLRVDDAGTRLVVEHVLNAGTGSPACFGPGSPASEVVSGSGGEQINSYYVFENDRDFRVAFLVRLSVLRRTQAVHVLLVTLLVLLVAALTARAPQNFATLAVAAGPVGVTASVLLLRESSTLGSRLRRTLTSALLLALAALLVVSVWRFLTLPVGA